MKKKSEKFSFDKDYSEVIKEINAKLNEAAKLVKEATNFASKSGIPQLNWSESMWEYNDSLSELTEEEQEKYQEEILGEIDTNSLYNACDSIWRMSSIGC